MGVVPLLRQIARPAPGEVAASVEEWLRQLAGPTLIHVGGRDRERTRGVITLLHGNEPSGTRAVHRWLQEGRTPATDTFFVIAAVEAALHPPGFAHRMLPGRRDLNRCFVAPFEGREGQLAAAILAAIEEVQPEALIDMHNNSGHSPPYGIGTRVDPRCLALAALFADHYVLSDLDLGAVIEVIDDGIPSCTIECGRAGDPAADQTAAEGLAAFLAAERMPAVPDRSVTLLRHPIRVALKRGATIGVGEGPSPDYDLIIAADMDRHNFQPVAAGTTLGWIRDGAWPLEAHRSNGGECTREHFEVVGGELRTRRPLVPIMMTTDAAIAASDCLFYIVSS